MGADAHGVRLRVAQATLNAPVPTSGSFTQVSFRQVYATPPLVFVLATSDNSDPAALRVVNVTTTGFDLQQFESQGEDGLTTATTVQYLAIEPGTYTLPSGAVVEAGSVAISNHQGRNVPGAAWSTLNFANTFPANPVLLLQTQTNNNGPLVPGAVANPYVTAVSRNVGTTTAQIALERSETSVGVTPNTESVAYLVMQPTVTTVTDNAANAINIEALRSANNVQGWDNLCRTVNFNAGYPNPVVLAHKITRNGGDGGWLRRCSLATNSVGLTVDEDRAGDTERSHTNETAALLLFSQPFDGSLGAGNWEADNANLSATAGASLTFTSVFFPSPMEGVPVVLTQPTEPGTNPAAIRIRNVTANGFEAAQVEPPGSPGAHVSMTIDYIAVVPGEHQLQDGTQFEAGFTDTIQVQRAANVGGPQGWATVNFAQTYAQAPAFLTHLQTTNNSDPDPDPSTPLVPWLTVAVENLNAASVQVALERAEADDGVVASAERVGYLVFPSGLRGVLTDVLGNSIDYDSRRVDNAVTGYDNGCFPVAYNAAFGATPLAVGSQNSRAGNNGGWLRRCGINGTALSQHVDEDQDNDPERSHIAEDVSQMAFSQGFDWRPFPDIVLAQSLVTVTDGVSVTNPKSLPGAEIDTTVQVTNQGAGTADTDSVAMVFPIAGETELFVGDLDGAGNAVVFIDGTTPNASGLTWLPATQVSYSDDNAATFTYVPPAALDFDPQVTHLRIAPTGTLAGASPGVIPTYSVRYRVRVR